MSDSEITQVECEIQVQSSSVKSELNYDDEDDETDTEEYEMDNFYDMEQSPSETDDGNIRPQSDYETEVDQRYEFDNDYDNGSVFSLNFFMDEENLFCPDTNQSNNQIMRDFDKHSDPYLYEDHNDNTESMTIKVDVAQEVNQSANPQAKKTVVHQPSSVVYIITPEKNLYKLSFNPVNCYFRPLFLAHRDIDINSNNKKNQPYSRVVYRDGKPLKAKNQISRLNNLYKAFETDSRKNGVCILERSALKKKEIAYPKYKPIKKIKTSAISKPCRDPMESIIYIEHKDVLFSIKTGMLMINRIRPQKPELPEFTKLKGRLSLLGMKDRINKGQLLVRYKNDILLFKFDMDNVTFGKYKSNVSIGTQVETNKSIYLPTISSVNERNVMVGVPKTLYQYEDICFRIYQYNKSQALSKKIPDWMVDIRRKRMKNSVMKPFEREIERVIKCSNGSVLLFEGLNCEIKSEAGVVRGYISKGKKKYENYVKSEQRAKLGASGDKKEGDEFGKSVDRVYDYKVADHDLVDQTK